MRRRGVEKKKRGRKAERPKRWAVVTHRRGGSTADLQEQLDHRTRELHEALEQQTATAEILRIISSSPTGVQRVFDTIVRNFVSLCGSLFGSIFTFDGKLVHFVGAYGFSPELLNEVRKKYPVQVNDRSVASARAILAKAPVHIQDTMSDPHYDREHAAAMGRSRRMLAVPMLREGAPLGAIVAAWAEAGATPKQHEHLLKVFADQAVIAIENARLLNELRESLQQQTATADVLKVISTSPGELEPVFNAMLENATRICDAEFGTLYLRETNSFRAVAIHNAPPAYVQARMGNQVRPPPDSALGQVATTHQVAQIDDARKTKSYVEGNPYAVSAVELGGYRTIAAVPMLKEDELVGAILIYRQEVRPFSEKQIALLQNFAAQAVIAIENARLLNELRESLDQQTATSDVLKVISSSPGQLEPVFQTNLANAVRICEAKFGVLYPYENNRFRPAAEFGVPPALSEFIRQRGTFQARPESTLDRLAQSKQVIYCDDIAEDPTNPMAKFGGARTYVAVPMLKESELIGTIIISARSSSFLR
jgi:GAF domain-containing protein